MARRANNEGNIRQRPDGRWEARATGGIDFHTGEKKRISVYGQSQGEVLDKLRALEHDIHCKDITNPTSTTLLEWLNLFLDVYLKNNLKQSTYVGYRSYIDKHFAPAFPSLKLKDLNTRLLQDFYNFKFEEEELSPKTLANLNRFLHKALHQAVLEHYIGFNPCDGIILPRADKPNIEILTVDQQNRLISTTYQFRLGFFVRLAFATGMRIAEITGLRWEDIDLANRCLYVRRTLSRLPKVDYDGTGNSTEIVIQSPKTKNSIRMIPLIPQMVREFQQWRRLQMQEASENAGVYRDSGMVLTNPFGGYMEPRTLKDHYNSMLAASGIGHFTFHAARHTFATRAMERGMDAKTISALLGHASTSFTLDTYTHVLDTQRRDGMALMDDIFAVQNDAPYPVVISQQGSEYLLDAVDFQGVSIVTGDVMKGIELLRQMIMDRYDGLMLPPATPYDSLVLQPSEQYLLLRL